MEPHMSSQRKAPRVSRSAEEKTTRGRGKGGKREMHDRDGKRDRQFGPAVVSMQRSGRNSGGGVGRLLVGEGNVKGGRANSQRQE